MNNTKNKAWDGMGAPTSLVRCNINALLKMTGKVIEVFLQFL